MSDQQKPSILTGYTDYVTGVVKENVGHLLGNTQMEVEGKARKEKGNFELAAHSALDSHSTSATSPLSHTNTDTDTNTITTTPLSTTTPTPTLTPTSTSTSTSTVPVLNTEVPAIEPSLEVPAFKSPALTTAHDVINPLDNITDNPSALAPSPDTSMMGTTTVHVPGVTRTSMHASSALHDATDISKHPTNLTPPPDTMSAGVITSHTNADDEPSLSRLKGYLHTATGTLEERVGHKLGNPKWESHGKLMKETGDTELGRVNTGTAHKVEE